MESNFLRINFAESKIPIFKENKAKGYLTYGEDNAYPQMLIDFYNSSPKHGAIVTQKAAFLAGDKTEIIGANTQDVAKANDYLNNINAYESFDEVNGKQRTQQNIKTATEICLKYGYRLCLQQHKIVNLP